MKLSSIFGDGQKADKRFDPLISAIQSTKWAQVKKQIEKLKTQDAADVLPDALEMFCDQIAEEDPDQAVIFATKILSMPVDDRTRELITARALALTKDVEQPPDEKQFKAALTHAAILDFNIASMSEYDSAAYHTARRQMQKNIDILGDVDARAAHNLRISLTFQARL